MSIKKNAQSNFITTHSHKETFNYGFKIGSAVKPGMVIPLFGELGSGKTCLTQGIARGFGIPKEIPITSPSYTLINEYDWGQSFFHVDLYRLSSEWELDDIGLYEIVNGDGIVVIEWAERLPYDFLQDRMDIYLTITDAETRNIEFKIYNQADADLINRILRD
ncbi:tRNA threonylcarbamoyladenosine biosynthesis protein TsaE [Candidatus Magnetomoraceae bacterium gMMP-15]